MGISKRRTYTPEYRPEAARLVIDTGRRVAMAAAQTIMTVTRMCRRLGVDRRRFYEWRAGRQRDRRCSTGLWS